MRAEERRQAIQDILQHSPQPVSAGTLAARFSVSRQIIVGDVALLRAAGADISATPRGYVIQKFPSGLIRQVACRHNGAEMETELNAMVDQGCTVLDVIVDHPIYGQLTGPLQLSIAILRISAPSMIRSMRFVIYANCSFALIRACGTVAMPAASAMHMISCSASGNASNSWTCGFRIYPFG